MFSHSGKNRWHKDHPSPCGNHSNHKQFINNFNNMNPPIDVINCTRVTALTAFPKIDLDNLLKNNFT
jgi:hypothetical protein